MTICNWVKGAWVAVALLAALPPAFGESPFATSSEFRRALHSEANSAVGELVEVMGDSELPAIARGRDNVVSYIGASPGTSVPLPAGIDSSSSDSIALGFLKHYARAFGIYSADTALYVKRVHSEENRTYVRLGQTFAGYEVYGAEAIVQLDNATNGVTAVFSDLLADTYDFDSGQAPVAPTLSFASAEQQAEANVQQRLDFERQNARNFADELRTDARLTSEEHGRYITDLAATTLSAVQAPVLLVYAPDVLGLDGGPRLAWVTQLRSDPLPLAAEEVLLDAETGLELLAHSLLRNAKARYIHDSNNLETTWAVLKRQEGGAAIGDAEVDQQYERLGQAYDYFNTKFGHDSFNDAGALLRSYVRWGTTPHAKWDKTMDSDFNGQPGPGAFHFGPGNYARADDIAGHEYAHAVIDYTWAPTAVGETGAIAESLADAWGEFIDWSSGGDGATNRWLIGEDLTGGAIRDMEDPNTYGQPSWRGSTSYYYGTDNPTYVTINGGVGNNLWRLLTDGGTYRDITVTGLGQATVEALMWECQMNALVNSADYVNLYEALRTAADALYTGTAYDTVIAAIEKAGEAVGISTDLQTQSSAPKSSNVVHIWESGIWAGPSDGFPAWKRIPYKVYVPGDGYSLGSRGTADWPLDVIVLSHGAGMNREIATGYDANSDGDLNDTGDVVGLATYWAQQGYIVVVPTYRKRMHLGPFWAWEFPYLNDNEIKFATDFLQAVYLHPAEFFVDRVHDLKFIREHLEDIINVGTTTTAYDSTEVNSAVALAGHSFGAVTTMLAAGAVVDVGNASTPLALEDHGFAREFEEGAGTADDHGAFVAATAYLLISGAFNDPTDEQTLVDSARSNLTGRDYVQKPLMVATAEQDFTATPGEYFTPVTDAVGINGAPSYGLAVSDANHLTSVSQFKTLLLEVPSWNSAWTMISSLLDEFSTQEERDEFADVDSKADLDDYWDAVFLGAGNQALEEARLEVFKSYTRNFWDAFLSPEYAGTTALTFLNQDTSTHEGGTYVEEFGASQPTQVFFVRDSAGAPLLQFQSDGNVLVLEGDFLQNQTSMSQGAASEFVLKNNSGTIEAMISESSGNFQIRKVKTIHTGLSTSSGVDEFVIQNESDASGDAQIIIEEDGDLKLRGDVYDDDDL